MADIADSRVWLITGTSSGLGHALLEAVLKRGERAVATVRKPAVLADLQAKYPAEQLLVLTLDVTDAVQIAAVFQRIEEHFHRLDVVVNNAGYLLVGEVEATSDEEARLQVETLFWGPVNITRQAVRFFREVNPKGHGGRILNMSSVGGYTANPTTAFYNAGKFALEAFTESIVREMPPDWNITGAILEPGGFVTNIWSSGLKMLAPHAAYPADGVAARYRHLMAHYPSMGDAEKAAEVCIRIAGEKELPLRIQLGTDAWLTVKERAEMTLRDQERWEEVSHGTNIEGSNHLDVLAKVQEALSSSS